MDKKNTVFLSVIAVATLLTAVVGTTFAYFTATVKGTATDNNAVVKTATLGLGYSQETSLAINNWVPGDKAELKFNVTNESENPTNFTLVWGANVQNTIATATDHADVTYKIEQCTDATYETCNTTIHASSELPAANAEKQAITGAEKLTVNAKSVNYYKVTATFAAKQTPQDSLKEKKFVGTVVVGEAGTNVGQ